jgi:hypothetical protein
MNHPVTVVINIWPEVISVCRLAAAAEIPGWVKDGIFISITRTADELSIVCAEGVVPDDVQTERGWRMLQTQGPLDFGLVGVLASITAPLAEAGVSIFAISTYDTDYVLVKDADLRRAVQALEAAGHTLRQI